jgi:hypothetical protein
MIFTSQMRRNMDTTIEITPKTTKKAVALLGTDNAIELICLRVALHGRSAVDGSQPDKRRRDT